jgi:GTP-binding protein
LLFVVDAAGSEGRHPLEDLQSLRREIDLYDTRLSQRPWCIVANKTDLAEADENLRLLRERFPAISVLPISAERGEGMAELREYLARWVEETPAPENAATVEVGRAD